MEEETCGKYLQKGHADTCLKLIKITTGQLIENATESVKQFSCVGMTVKEDELSRRKRRAAVSAVSELVCGFVQARVVSFLVAE